MDDLPEWLWEQFTKLWCFTRVGSNPAVIELFTN